MLSPSGSGLLSGLLRSRAIGQLDDGPANPASQPPDAGDKKFNSRLVAPIFFLRARCMLLQRAVLLQLVDIEL